MTRQVHITFDCADPAALAAFWAEALGYQIEPPPPGFDSWEAALTAFKVPEDQWNSRSALQPRGRQLFPRRSPAVDPLVTRVGRSPNRHV